MPEPTARAIDRVEGSRRGSRHETGPMRIPPDSVDDQPTSAIIRSKVQSPVLRATTLERRRLLGG